MLKKDDAFNQITIPPAVYDLESLNNEIQRFTIEEGCFTEANYPYTNKPSFSTLGSIIEVSSINTGSQNAFTPDHSIRDLLGYKLKVIHEEYNLSIYSVGTLSFDIIFLETYIAQRMSFKGKRLRKNHNFAINVDLRYKCLEKFRGGLKWYMMNTKDFISKINFNLKNENNKLVSLN